MTGKLAGTEQALMTVRRGTVERCSGAVQWRSTVARYSGGFAVRAAGAVLRPIHIRKVVVLSLASDAPSHFDRSPRISSSFIALQAALCMSAWPQVRFSFSPLSTARITKPALHLSLLVQATPATQATQATQATPPGASLTYAPGLEGARPQGSLGSEMLKAVKDEPVMATQAGLADSNKSSLCFHSALGFFFNKGVRGGPRVLLNLASLGLLLGLLVFVKLLPFRGVPIPKNVWSEAAHPAEDRPVGLRIVVFGELDVGTPVGVSQEHDGAKTWTEALCDQLACDIHISMVPPPETASWSVSSNQLYAYGVEKVLNETAYSNGPGHDYSFLSTSYPPQWKSWDLEAQIDGFLAMPKGPTPLSTLWVFSFGQWDVWTLSALPINRGMEAVDAMTADIFAQLERLYVASMDPASVAYSDINGPPQTPDATTSAIGSPAQDHATYSLEVQDTALARAHGQVEQPAAAAAAAPAPAPAPAAATFRILLPRAIDPSLLPGWHALRPPAPAVHSKAEQLRNAAALAAAWHARMEARTAAWLQTTGAATPATPTTPAPTPTPTPVASSPGPVRDAFAYDLAGFVLARMRALPQRPVPAASGVAAGAAAFRDVRTPCLDAPPRHVQHGRGEEDEDEEEEAGEGKEEAVVMVVPGLAYLPAATACAVPGDHLFYTPFALSQRAILGVADEAAGMIRRGESVRATMYQPRTGEKSRRRRRRSG